MKKYFSILLTTLLLGLSLNGRAQQAQTNEKMNPVVNYSSPKQYEIGGITVSGIKNQEDYLLIGLSGLAVGQTITVPGDEITQAIKRYWKHGLFSDVAISATKIEGNKVYLNIALKQRPRISQINYNGIKKSDREDLEAKLGLIKGSQITPNLVDRAKMLIKKHFDEKGFKNAEVEIVQRDDVNNSNEVIVDVNIDKKDKIKIHKITIEGNKALSTKKIKRLMKKTNEKGKLRNLFRTKKFVDEKYKEDKQKIIDKYNELGYRDARIINDSVIKYNEKTVNIHMEISEGQKYYIHSISWIGNTIYPTEFLNNVLRMKAGDVYDQKLLDQRTNTDDDAIGNLYYNNGYVFFHLDPVETNVVKDSIDLEMRIFEGKQATIDHVRINGNDRVYENVIRRELYVKPGQLFSKDALMRSYREIAQMGHFNPENIKPDVQPDESNGTVDINWGLESKANDQVELSAGWGQTGIIGKVSLKFTNFSMANLLHPGQNYRGILPQGDGQTLTISGQTNGTYYQSYSIGFSDPWFGGKRPNSFSLSAFYSKQTDISSSYYGNSYGNSSYNSLYSSYYGSSDNSNLYDKSKSVQIYGASVGWGKRLNWPDNYFEISGDLTLQRYQLKNWRYFPVTNGNCNSISIGIALSRNSTDSPIFPRHGSSFTLSLKATPPYSWFDGVDYSKYDKSNQTDINRMNRWIEFNKWKFNSKTFTALTNGNKCPVLMTRADFGFVGSYNKYKKSPFETFDVGGDGMTGYSAYATESVALRGYENSSLTPTGYEGYAYSRLGMELRYPLMLENSTSIYILGFVEAGNAWQEIKNFTPFDLKRSAGVGVRIFLPMVGMMGIDWGYGFDKVFGSTQYGGSNFHFILGQEF
jgi:outer membrane protein insertion porin family